MVHTASLSRIGVRKVLSPVDACFDPKLVDHMILIELVNRQNVATLTRSIGREMAKLRTSRGAKGLRAFENPGN